MKDRVHNVNKPFFKYRYHLLALPLTVAMLALPGTTEAGQPGTRKTLPNLQTAYSGERNAHVRYVAFAQKADEEGYGEVASLFRAAARAEEIHQVNHATVIRGMHAAPRGIVEFPVVKSTRENLLTAAKAEAYEREIMYPAFIEQAEAEHNWNATRTFDLARKAEVQHFNLFTNVLTSLENGWEISRTYYVCTVCGYTVDEPVSDHCISCARPAEKYEVVS